MRNDAVAAVALVVIAGAVLGGACGGGTPATPVGSNGFCPAGLLLCLGGSLCCPASTPTLCVVDNSCQPTCEGEEGAVGPDPCVQQCTDSSQCSGATPVCNPLTQLCVQCTDASHCGGSTPACSGGVCVQCTDSSQCSGATPACDVELTNTCVQCTDSSQCSGSTPFCEMFFDTCVECLTKAECPGTMQSCWAGKCAPCGTTGASCDDIAQCCSDQCSGGKCL